MATPSDTPALAAALALAGRRLVEHGPTASVGQHLQLWEQFTNALDAYEASQLRARPRYRASLIVDDEE